MAGLDHKDMAQTSDVKVPDCAGVCGRVCREESEGVCGREWVEEYVEGGWKSVSKESVGE
jgi:hypothetical protein